MLPSTGPPCERHRRRPVTSTPGGNAGEELDGFVSEICALGKNFAGVMNTQVKSGKIVFLGGTPGNGLSKGWQTCEKPALNKSIQVVGTADTDWTRQGSLQAMSGFLSKYPDLKGVSYEYADGFIGGVQAYKAAKKPINLVLTLRTDNGPVLPVEADQQPELQDLLLDGGNFQSRLHSPRR